MQIESLIIHDYGPQTVSGMQSLEGLVGVVDPADDVGDEMVQGEFALEIALYELWDRVATFPASESRSFPRSASD